MGKGKRNRQLKANNGRPQPRESQLQKSFNAPKKSSESISLKAGESTTVESMGEVDEVVGEVFEPDNRDYKWTKTVVLPSEDSLREKKTRMVSQPVSHDDSECLGGEYDSTKDNYIVSLPGGIHYHIAVSQA